MTSEITIDDITITVIQKNIRTLRLTVRPPHGEVRISAPHRIGLETIRQFAASKMEWIRRHQTAIKGQPWKAPLQYMSDEEHSFLGKQYRLNVIEHKAPAKVLLESGVIELYIRPKTSKKKRRAVLDTWYRGQLKEIIPDVIRRYEANMNVHAEWWGVKRMKTKWGTCNITRKRIWLNLELAKKPLNFIEHVIVHELVHLLERKHNTRFRQLMDQYLPEWRSIKEKIDE